MTTFFELVGKLVLSIMSLGLVFMSLHVTIENLPSSKLRYLTNSLGTGAALWTGTSTLLVMSGWIWMGDPAVLLYQLTMLFTVLLPMSLGVGFFYAYTRTGVTKVQDQKGVDQSHEEHSATE